MLNFFRSFMHSRIGVFLALGFLVLIALAFAAADVTGSGQFGSVTGGDRARPRPARWTRQNRNTPA